MLLKLDPRSYSPTGYRCFESYFININKQHGLIEKSEWSEDYDINDISLLGIQALWELILQARNDTVYRNAQNLFKRLFKGLRKNSLEMQQNFLKNCMNHIKSGAELLRESYNIDPVNRISRSLSLLYECIQDFEAKLIIKPTYKGDPIEVQIDNRTYLAENPKFFTIILYQEMTVGQALTLISNIIKPQIPVADLMIISKGKNLNDISEITSLNDLDISLKSTFVVYDRKEHENPSTPVLDYQVDPESLENLSGIFVGENEKLLILALKKAGGSVQEAVEILFDEESKAKLLENMTEIEPVEPVKYKITEDSTLSMIISNTQEYFNLLFELFELGNTTINIQIWTLLNKIPVNQEMYDNIKNLKIENDWNSLLDSTYMYKLLYSLQIVNSLLAQEDHMESIKWKAKFVEISGFSHIYKILMDADHLNLLSEQYQTHAKCIGVLLNLVKSFVESAMNRKIENPNDV